MVSNEAIADARDMKQPDTAEQSLERRIADAPNDAVAHYRLGTLLLASRDLYELHAPDDQGVVARAEAVLDRAVQLDPRRATGHAALGFARDQLGRPEDALRCFITARRLDPKNGVVDVYVPTLLAEMGRERDALADIARVARRRKVSLAQLRRELAAARQEPSADALLSGFVRARNHLWSWLRDEAERIRNSLSRGRRQRRAQAELRECEAMSRELRREFRASQVPRALRPLAPAAVRWGIDDDTCRPLLMLRIPRDARARLIRQADALAGVVNAWLDGFAPGKLSTEAAAFMYLMEGVDELRPAPRGRAS